MRRKFVFAVLIFAAAASTACAAKWSFSGSDRLRTESWDWFDTGRTNGLIGAENEYVFTANQLKLQAVRKSDNNDVTLEVSMPSFFNLPDNAVLPMPQFLLGNGAIYRFASRDEDTNLILQQANIRFTDWPAKNAAVRLGRMSVCEGHELQDHDPDLAWVKANRVARRLLCNVGYLQIQRNFDGVQGTYDPNPHRNWTTLIGSPTVGLFDLQGTNTLEEVDVAYTAYSFSGHEGPWDGRVFFYNYHDDRPLTVKTDNRPLALRVADTLPLDIQTIGGHYMRKWGRFDFVTWGALQSGDWGRQDHEGWAWMGEVGWQLSQKSLKPWLRAGISRTSGDDTPLDGKHETFMPLLTAPRIYARFPFYHGFMNLDDSYIMLVMRPDVKTTLRADYHNLQLAEANDLWYLGPGAINKRLSGFIGRPGDGTERLANMLDISLDRTIDKYTTFGIYGAKAYGGSVINRLFPGGKDANFAQIEVTRKF